MLLYCGPAQDTAGLGDMSVTTNANRRRSSLLEDAAQGMEGPGDVILSCAVLNLLVAEKRLLSEDAAKAAARRILPPLLWKYLTSNKGST